MTGAAEALAHPAARAAVAFALGAVVGSFLNVVVHRLPRGESVVRPRSRCPACGATIRARHNVPILSWVWLRGRCAACGAAIPVRYPAIEASTALLFAAFAWQEPPGVRLAAELWAVASLVAIFAIDLEHMIVPDALSLPGILVGLGAAALDPPPSLFEAAAGAAFGGGFLAAVAWGYERLRGREGLGFGDVKLVAMVGAFTGIPGALGTILVGSLLGILQFGLSWARGRRGPADPMPFGPALCVAALLHLHDSGFALAALGGR